MAICTSSEPGFLGLLATIFFNLKLLPFAWTNTASLSMLRESDQLLYFFDGLVHIVQYHSLDKSF